MCFLIHFKMVNTNLKSDFQFPQYLATSCNVILPYLGIKGEEGSKFNFCCRCIWNRNTKICTLANFRMGKSNMKSDFQYLQYMSTSCDVILPYLGIKGKEGSKFNSCRCICERNTKICTSANFRMGKSNMKSDIQYLQYMSTSCDVILPYLGIKGKEGSKFNSCRCICERNTKICTPANFRMGKSNMKSDIQYP